MGGDNHEHILDEALDPIFKQCTKLTGFFLSHRDSQKFKKEFQ